MPDRSRAVARRTTDRVGRSQWHQWRQLWEPRPRVRKNGELRVGKGDNLEIEWFVSAERDDLAVGQPDSELTIAIIRDRDDGELRRDMTQLARVRRVLLEKGGQ